uniref:NADH-ubiquinone oxidoreductase chain 2 n=1 Tax=Nemertopsis tetraclitophila TaxID=1417004 RepID=A0A075CEZ0_9BILA|nr:NADH dehydrogenase subunit 2 [Nemertopsis tetraclitophila]AGZ63912.1 NADH dehydrogenase subunit 2 [Nemertopsis tetraclitophila]
MFFPFFLFMGFFLLFGSLVSISSISWFGVWAGLELNMFCFLPMVIHLSSFLSVENVVKYFLIQSFGSIGLLFGGLFEDSNLFFLSFFSFVLYFSLVLKIGMFPFHWWVPGVLSGVSWFGVFLVLTWQKVAPVFLFSGLMSFYSLFLVLGGISSVVGGLGGIGQTSVRSILAYSSIGHAGWFVCLFCISYYYGFVYFFLYLISSLFLIFFFWVFDFFRLSQVFFYLLLVYCFFFFSVLGVSGVPPFLGFFGKILIFLCMSNSFLSFLVLFMLILGSLFSLYFYLGLFFFCFFFFFGFSVVLSSSVFKFLSGLVFFSFLFIMGIFFLDYIFVYF